MKVNFAIDSNAIEGRIHKLSRYWHWRTADGPPENISLSKLIVGGGG